MERPNEIPGWAVRGAKVVCIEAPIPEITAMHHRHPAVGDVVTIEATYWDDENGWWLRFDEYPCTEYDVANYRPVVPPKTQAQDVAQFLPLLKPQKAVERA